MHLHLLIHGMAGHPDHLAEAVRLFTARHSNAAAVHLLVAASFTYTNTYDGIDINADRVLHELDDAVLALEKDPTVRITKFSVTGYSLGGLIARYVVGALYSRGFFDSVEAVNFASFTTPHVGIPPPPYTSRLLFWLGSTVLGRTGKQLHLLDDSERPLLQIMAHPQSPFFLGLSKFRNINIYANAINDFTVPYFSGALEETDPFADHRERDIIPEYLPDYTPLIQGFSIVKYSPSFIARLKSLRPLTFNGPLIAWVFPWNLVLYLLLPLLLPLGIVYLALDYLFSSCGSRARIRLLQPSVSVPVPILPDLEAHGTPPNTLMTPAQAAMVRVLNALDGVRKYTAFRPAVRNAHAMLICLEPRFADHRVGRGVLRHWADNFEL
ncbi:DUF676-domain-containing protein [Mycena latifolia]|nr:DUF676-domain-containing protein [Mycena latifolia]